MKSEINVEKLKDPVKKALKHMNATTSFTAADLADLDDIVDTLRPIKAAVEVLKARDASLITADVTLELLLTKTARDEHCLIEPDVSKFDQADWRASDHGVWCAAISE